MVKSHGHYFNLAHLSPCSEIYGPGKRFAIWCQGCSLACAGCWNEDMWSFRPRNLMHREELLASILAATPDIRGVTLLGGEPLHQADNLVWLLEQLRRRSTLTVFLYTGYEPDELREMGVLPQLEALCDIIAVGRYKQEQRNINRQWLGSDNQYLIYPKDSRESKGQANQNEVEITIGPDGAMTVVGFPDQELIDLIAEI